MTFKLKAFGSFETEVNHQTIHFRTDKIRALLAYLATERDMPQSRHALATMFWSNNVDSKARTNLRISFHRLRQALDQQSNSNVSDHVFDSNRQHIQLVSSASYSNWFDVTSFQHLLAQAENHTHPTIHHCPTCLSRLEQAVTLYRGEFLQGIEVSDSEVFEEWLILKREQFHQQMLKTLETLVDAYLLQKQYDKVIQFGQKSLNLEPWHEKIHRQLMIAYALNDQREAAISQYQQCRQQLIDEMGLEPSVETTTIYQKIVKQEPIFVQTQTNPKENGHRATQFAQKPKHNIPSTLTPYFGRTELLQHLSQLLLNPDVRFVTLVGEGGVGKSRLSQESAKQILDGFEHGIWFVPFADIMPSDDSSSTQNQMATAVAQSIGLPLTGTLSPKNQLINFLKSRHLLLILDNLEHLIADTDWIHELLEETENVSVLCTSRTPLKFMAEFVVPVPQLPVPQTDDKLNQPATPYSEFSRFASIQLFADRAKRITGLFDLDEQNLNQVAQFCDLVGGNPLGIELAAALLTVHTLSEAIIEVEQTYSVLETELRDIPTRHRTMRAVFENSWQLLTPKTQQLFSQLSLFRGGFSLAAVQAITQATSADLVTLHRHSLLWHIDGRYQMHTLLQQFALEKFKTLENVSETTSISSGEKEVTGRYSQYYLDFLAHQEAPLVGEAPQKSVQEITPEIENIRHAWQIALKEDQIDALNESVGAFSEYLQLKGEYQEAEKLFHDTINQLSDRSRAGSTLLNKLRVYHLAALNRLSKYDEAAALAETALETAVSQQDDWAQGYLHLHWGESFWRQGKYEEATEKLNSALTIAQSHKIKRLEGSGYYHLNIVLTSIGEYKKAQEFASNALKIWRQIKNKKQEAYTLNSLGIIHLHLEEYEQANIKFSETLKISESIVDSHSHISSLNNLSLVAINQKQFSLAETYLLNSLRLALNAQDKYGEAMARHNLGWNAFQTGHFDIAENWLNQSLTLKQQMNDVVGQALTIKTIGDIAYKKELIDQAQGYYLEALKLGEGIGDNYVIQIVNESLKNLNDNSANEVE